MAIPVPILKTQQLSRAESELKAELSTAQCRTDRSQPLPAAARSTHSSLAAAGLTSIAPASFDQRSETTSKTLQKHEEKSFHELISDFAFDPFCFGVQQSGQTDGKPLEPSASQAAELSRHFCTALQRHSCNGVPPVHGKGNRKRAWLGLLCATNMRGKAC